MIPVVVRLQNFRGYADQTLDFRGIRSVLFYGPTGSGKSAIPGAILWALTGRNGSSDPKGHVKLGADLCQVEFQCEHAGSTYRIVRSQSLKTARGKSDLQYGASDGHGGWIPKGGKSMDETQALIDAMIGMTYDELTCGPFALQDQAGKFVDPPELRIDGKTYKGRSARLQVTLKMLGLSRYEQWRVAASQEIRDLESKALEREGRVRDADARLEGRDALETVLATGEAEIQWLRNEAERVERERGVIEAEVTALTVQIETARTTLQSLDADRKTLAALGQSLHTKQQQADRYRDILSHREAIEDMMAKAATIAQQLGSQRERIQHLDGEISSLLAKRDALTARQRDCQRAERTVADQQAKHVSTLKLIGQSIATSSRQAELLERVPCLGVEDLAERCPLLSDARQAKHRLADLTAQNAAASACTPDPGLMELVAQLPSVTEGVDGASAALSFLTGERQKAEGTIRSLEKQREETTKWTRLHAELDLAAQALPILEAEMVGLEAQRISVEERVAGLRYVAQALTSQEQDLVSLRQQLGVQRMTVSKLAQQERACLESVAARRAEIVQVDKLAEERAVLSEEVQALRGRHTRLVALAEFYRQAPIMILDNIAKPVLEEEANRILAKISPTRMQVRVETQRELRTRDAMADGLEIHVRDVKGERSVDDFSGGQRFQLFLAFRIAWTKLQERRSGTGIDMLWIDEGFGSQSEDCLEAVIAALRGIQDEFPFLAVISHVAAMRDVFPARIEVTGGMQDSRAEIVTT